MRATEQQRMFMNGGQGSDALNDESGSDDDDLAAHEKKNRKIFDDDENSGEPGSSDLSSG